MFDSQKANHVVNHVKPTHKHTNHCGSIFFCPVENLPNFHPGFLNSGPRICRWATVSGPANRATTDVLCVLSSTVSGEPLAVLETYEGISAKEMKQSLQSQIGVPRFRQKLFLEDRTQEIQDDEVLPYNSQDEAGALRILAA